MGLFHSKDTHTSLVLIDIDSDSVGGALCHSDEGGIPTVYYTVRKSIEAKPHEESTAAMLRILEVVTASLSTTGAAILRQETRSAHIDKILVSVGAPWQKTSVRIESIAETKPFIFNQALLAKISKEKENIPEGFILSSESVIATLLNGYETPRPFGEKVTRADMIVLSSMLDKTVAQAIEMNLRRTYHTHAFMLTSFASVADSVFLDIYPHEKDFLVLSVSGEETDIAFVKRGLLVDTGSILHGTNDLIRNTEFGVQTQEVEKNWLNNVKEVLQEAAVRHALPRTLFLLATNDSRDYVKLLLDTPRMRSLWLTDEPLRIIAVAPGHLSDFVKIRGDAEGDLYLMLLAIFGRKIA